MGLLSRIVIDEVHTIIIWKVFRLHLERLWGILQVPVPLLLLTGTLPISMEDHIFSILKISRSEINIYRQNSINPLAIYQVLKDVSLRYLTQQIRGLLTHTKKIIVFAKTYNECDFYSQQFSISFPNYMIKIYNSNLCDSEKVSNYKDWVESDMGLMISTTAISHGVDTSNVGLVLVTYIPDPLEMIQMFGRAGRNGGDFYNILYYKSEELINGDEFMKKYTSESCRRKTLYSFLDGQEFSGDSELVCIQNNWNLCDFCTKKQTRHDAIPAVLHERADAIRCLSNSARVKVLQCVGMRCIKFILRNLVRF